MSQACNVQPLWAVPSELASALNGDWKESYESSESFVETGSAFFAQAGAEAWCLTADLELRNVRQATSRAEVARALLDRALTEYRRADVFDATTGLANHHHAYLSDCMRRAGGVRSVLHYGGERGFWQMSPEALTRYEELWAEGGHCRLMEEFLDRLGSIRGLLSSTPPQGDPTSREALIPWQEFSWELNSRFMQAMEAGQVLAIVNTLTPRLAEQFRTIADAKEVR